MGALGQPPHDPFCSDDGEEKALGVAVQRGANMQAARAQKLLAGEEIGRWAGHMFDHLHV